MRKQRTPTDVEIKITALGADGLGLADREGKPLSVRNALPGEQVTARILKRRKGRLFADGLNIIGPAHGQRVNSACTHFPRCGGCAMHHLSYAEQLRTKQKLLEQALNANHVEVENWREPVSRARLHYRRKARLGVRVVGDAVLVGFRESFSNRVARLQACVVLTPELSALLEPLKATIAGLSEPHTIPQIELAQGDSSAAIIVRHLGQLTPQDVDLWRLFERQRGVQVLLQSGGYDTVCGLDDASIRNLSYQHLGQGLTLNFDPRQFTQVNQSINTALVTAVLCELGVYRGAKVVDMFCGIGNFSLPLSRLGLQVIGYESAADAIVQARENAQLNHLPGTFQVADLYDVKAPTLLQADTRAMLLDPPRSGAGPQLKSWIEGTELHRIVYVSCGPESFAQDAATLQMLGYKLRSVGIYDMFPHTAHVETLGVFEPE